jgi:hypothetical protein
MMRTSSPKTFAAALVAAVAALALLPGAAGAASYLLRPSYTTSLQSGWSVSPSSSSADAVLAKPVSQPATPATSSYLTAGPGSSGSWAGVGVAVPPAFATGETLKTTTAWVYLGTATSQTLDVSLWTGAWFAGFRELAVTTVPAGQPAGWYSVSTNTALSSTDLARLAIGLQPSGTGANSKAYAAYAQVDTNDPPASASVPTVSPPPTTPQSPLTTPATPVSLASLTVTLSLKATSIPLTLDCAANVAGGCKGTVVISRLGPTPKTSTKSHPRAQASRCARGCRVLGSSRFNIAAGKRRHVKVHLAHSASRLFGRHHSVKVKATTTIRDRSGHNQTTSTTLTLTRPGAAPPGGSPPQGAGNGQAPGSTGTPGR